MRKIMLMTTVILLLVFVATPVAAQEMKKIAQAGLQFLKIDPAARSASDATRASSIRSPRSIPALLACRVSTRRSR